MPFQPIFDAFAARPPSATLKVPNIKTHSVLRDQFPITTWLLLGAFIQGLATLLLPYRNIVLVLPVILILLFKIISTTLTVFGILANPDMKPVINGRTSPVYPSPQTNQQDTPADQKLCAIMLAVVSNHPLGMLAPGFKDTGDRFEAMLHQLSANATQHGFLGGNSWLNASDKKSSNEIMTMLYFENEDYLHAYAHGPMHSEALQWWKSVEKDVPHLGIMHEVFACGRKSWEGIYVNYQPTGLGATTKEVVDKDGKSTWVNPLVRVKGQLSYSNGRMGRTENNKGWSAGDDLLEV